MYERLWTLGDASIGAAITLDTLRLGQIKGPERVEALANELVICVFSFAIYRLKDGSLFRIKPTETILKAASVRRHSLRTSDERALSFVLQQAKLLRKVASGESISCLRVERLLAFTVALSRASRLEWEENYRVRSRRRRHLA